MPPAPVPGEHGLLHPLFRPEVVHHEGGVLVLRPALVLPADGKAGVWKGQAVKNVWWVVSNDGKRNLTCLPEGAVPPTS